MSNKTKVNSTSNDVQLEHAPINYEMYLRKGRSIRNRRIIESLKRFVS